MHKVGEYISQLECDTWYDHPRCQECVLSWNLRIFKVATWHDRCLHHHKKNCIWHNLLYWVSFCKQNTTICVLTYWGRATHICVSKLTIIGSDNGLSPDRRQAIIWTNAGLLLIGHLGTNFSEILIEILTFSFKKMRLKVSYAKRRPFWSRPQCIKGCFRVVGLKSQHQIEHWRNQSYFCSDVSHLMLFILILISGGKAGCEGCLYEVLPVIITLIRFKVFGLFNLQNFWLNCVISAQRKVVNSREIWFRISLIGYKSKWWHNSSSLWLYEVLFMIYQ